MANQHSETISVRATESLHHFFPATIQASEIEDAVALNEALIAEIVRIRDEVPNTKPDSWSCDVYTTIDSGAAFDMLSQGSFATLKEIVLREAFKYGRSLGLDVDTYPLIIDDFWLNVYGRGHAQELHTHGKHVFSGIYYVKTPPGCGDTIFQAPMADTMIAPPRKEINPLNSQVARWTPRAGQMLLFRGWLKHSVQANSSDEERITVAFNLNLSGKSSAE
jgi:uncharacterized protein (TIGR02466 family)